MNQYFVRFPRFRKKAVTLSYDDGAVQDRRLIQLLDSYGMKGTFNLNSSFISDTISCPMDRPHLKLEEARELYGRSVHEVAVHGLTHPFLTQYPVGRAAWEIIRDRNNLEAFFGQIIRGMAYPMGRYNDELVDTLEHCGIVYARTTVDSLNFELPDDWFRIKPTCHHDNPDLFKLCRRFLELEYPYASKLFYLWGHSYEFDDNNNWNVIEQFCDMMGGREDIWYATSIEIHNYLKAASNLELSVDGSIVHNPTAISIYFDYQNSNYLVKPDETLFLV